MPRRPQLVEIERSVMSKPTPNPHVAINNAKEEARLETRRQGRMKFNPTEEQLDRMWGKKLRKMFPKKNENNQENKERA